MVVLASQPLLHSINSPYFPAAAARLNLHLAPLVFDNGCGEEPDAGQVLPNPVKIQLRQEGKQFIVSISPPPFDYFYFIMFS